jgi:acetyl esterase/lipase
MPMGTRHPAPPFDRDLAPVLAAVPGAPADVADLVSRRSPTATAALDARLDDLGLVREDRVVPGAGGHEITLCVVRSVRGRPGPGFVFAHSGGMVLGDRLRGLEQVLPWVARFGGAAVSVEYRLAPEHPDPAPSQDCYAALEWTVARADELGVDADRVITCGTSAGGGLLAGAALRARDTGGPVPAAQLLLSPMLDDRNDSASARQLEGVGLWDRASNRIGWEALLGPRRGTADVSSWTAPARATDLSGLPPTYLDCGSAEGFRDEVVAFAAGIWAAGGVADLHVWAGGCHAFDSVAPDTALSAAARAARTAFVERVLR